MYRKTLVNKLTEYFNFSEKEALVYIALIENGESSATQIAQQSKLKRTTVYNILPLLQQKGLIKNTVVYGKKHFFIDNVEAIKNRLFEQQEIADELIGALKSIQGDFKINSKVKIFEGKNSLAELYTEMLNTITPGDELMSIFGNLETEDSIPQELIDFFTKERVKKNIFHKIISANSNVIEQIKKDPHQNTRSIKLFDVKNHFDADIRIYRNHVAMCSHKDNITGILIQSKDLYVAHKEIFDKLWEKL